MSENRRPSATAGTGDIRCPYFVAHSQTEIVCEGLIDDCRSVMRFRSADGKTFHQKTYCEQEYKRCEMRCAIEHFKWPED